MHFQFPDIGVHNEGRLRKDSTCSNDITFLCIGSGRTSRVSSVGSVASGGSGISNLSAATSHLSATSNLSRGSSPHRTSVETSFCGPKPALTQSFSLEDDASTTIVLNKICQKLSTVLADESKNEKTTDKIAEANDVITQKSKSLPKATKGSNIGTKSRRKKPKIVNPKTQLFVSLHSDEENESVESCTAPVANITSVKSPPPTVTLESTQIFIPLKGDPKEELQNRRPGAKFSTNSPRKPEPFTNATLVNFISKYDVNSDRREDAAARKTEDETYTQTEINKEFQTFISLKDDDDRAPTSSEVESNKSFKKANDAKIGATVTATTTVIVPAQYGSNREVEVTSTDSSASQKDNLPIARTTTVTSGCAVTQIEKYNQDQPNHIKADLNSRQSGTDGISTNRYETKFESHDCTNLELNFSECPTRLAKSMTQLVSSNSNNKMEYYLPKAPMPNGCDGRYLKVDDNHRFRRSSESEKEMAGKTYIMHFT